MVSWNLVDIAISMMVFTSRTKLARKAVIVTPKCLVIAAPVSTQSLSSIRLAAHHPESLRLRFLLAGNAGESGEVPLDVVFIVQSFTGGMVVCVIKLSSAPSSRDDATFVRGWPDILIAC